MMRQVAIVLALATAAAAQDFEEPNYPYLSTRGQVQIQFDSGARGATFGDDPAFNGIASLRASDRLDNRRSRVITTLHLSPETEISNETDYNTRSNQVSVLDIYLRQRLNDNVYLRAGMFKIPFGWEGLRSSRTTNTIEMSDVTRALSQVRDSGLAFNGSEGGLDWAAGVFQGQGNVWTDRDAGKNLAARLGYKFNPELRAGFSLQYGTFESLPVRRWALELQYSEGPFKVESEYLWSDGYNLTSQRSSRAQGFYTALIYQMAEDHDLVLHYDRFDPDLDAARENAASNSSNARNRLVVGYNYYFQRSPEHRIMVNYEIPHEEEGPRFTNSGLRVRYQYAW